MQHDRQPSAPKVESAPEQKLVAEVNDEGLRQDAAPESSVRPLKLLLVEDSEVNREVALIQLNAWNHQVSTAENGKIAVDLLRHEHFDGVLMDCQMPEMDGYEATRTIRNTGSGVINNEIYIIAMTANALQGDREKCMEAGMNDYVSKPVDENELLAALQRCSDHAPVSSNEPVQPVNPPAPAEGKPAPVQSKFPPHLIDLFIQETGRRLEELRQNLEQHAMEEACRAAHTIKGTAGNFNAPQLAELAKEIESSCHQGDEQKAWELLPRIQQIFDEHRSSLTAHDSSPDLCR